MVNNTCIDGLVTQGTRMHDMDMVLIEFAQNIIVICF